jgi:hypothetical protein
MWTAAREPVVQLFGDCAWTIAGGAFGRYVAVGERIHPSAT